MTGAKRYRKTPVVIEAIKWTGDNQDEVSEFITSEHGYFDPTKLNVIINTLEGPVTASRGDYIIKGVAGEFYPCKPSIFEATYSEEVASE